MQRVETFTTLIESRDKHLASLRAEAEVLCPDLLNDLEKCQVSLGHVKRRYTNKRVIKPSLQFVTCFEW